MLVAALAFAGVAQAEWTADESRLKAELPRIKAASVAHIRSLLKEAAPQFGTQDPMPQYFKDGKVNYGPLGNWISGFFPGSLWKLYDLTGEADLKDAAIRYTDLLAKITSSRQHDIGFMLYCPMGEGLRLAPEKKSDYKRWLMEGCETLSSLYNPDLGLIRSWPWGNHLVIIDNMMNLEMLEWGAKNGGSAQYHEIALSHARRTDENHFRPDGGAYHVLDYDPNNPDWVLAVYSKQGANLVKSSWSRGQGWATYGFTMMYRETGERRFLVRAMKSADYAIEHPNMPADGVPPWDFGVKPTVGPQPRSEADAKKGIVVRAGDCDRDASAAALMASSFLELAELAPPERGKVYRAYAVKTLLSLASKDYFAAPEGEGNFLIKHFASARPINLGFNYLKQGNREAWFDSGVNYADYYFLEALQRFEKGLPKCAAKRPAFAELGPLGYSFGASALDEMMLIKRRICPREWMGPKKQDIAATRKAMTKEGSWPDIDYALWTKRNDACFGDHFSRVQVMAKGAFSLEDQSMGRDAIKATLWWIDNVKGKNPNWWPNKIGVPRRMCDAMLLVDDLLDDAERAKIYDYLAVCTIDANSTGGNLTDEAYITMERAILGRDERLLAHAVREISDEIRIAPEGLEGIQEDWSFHQHGPQQQMCTYGYAFLDPAFRFMRLLKGTRWELPPEKFALCCNMLQEGCRWLLWKDSLDVASIGRHFTHHCQIGRARETKRLMSVAASLGWEFPKEPPEGFRYFHKSAQAIYRTKEFMFSMRGCTKSVRGLETHVMGMNKLGGHLTDGSLFTYVTGQEYTDIYPLWNWRMLPGLTSYTDLKPVRRSFQDEYNVSPNELEDMDGVSDGKDGAKLHYAFRRDGLSFVNDYAFSPAGVTVSVKDVTSSRTDSRVSTCVEHSLAQPDAKAFPWENGCVRAVNGGITYLVYGHKDAIHCEIADRTGDWKDMNTERSSQPCSGRVFQLWIDHGTAPQNAAFRYEIRPCSFE